MLDVHPAHHPAHSWRDFFIHIATICVGLLIAVSLEQSVEAIHRHHEATALRKDLRGESQQVLKDARVTEAALSSEMDWTNHRIAQVKGTVWNQQPLPPPNGHFGAVFSSPDTPIWRSAKAGALTPLLSKGEINAYSEVEYTQQHVESLANAVTKTQQDLHRFNNEFPALSDTTPDLSKASAQDLHEYLTLLTTALEADRVFMNWTRLLLGAEIAVADGKTDLTEIYASENKALANTQNPNQ